MIEAHQLTKRYGDETAVEDLSFAVPVSTGSSDRKLLTRAAWP